MEAIERITVTQDWITLLLVLAFVLLVIARYFYTQRFDHFIMLFATDKYLLIKGKKTTVFHPFNLLLFTINVISVALFIYLFYLHLSEAVPDRPQVLFLRIATAYTSFILLKFSLEKILANIISADRKMDTYLVYKLTYRNFMSLVLLPISIIYIYVWQPSTTALYVTLAVILFGNLITLVGFFRKNQQYIMSYWFYFILYLCALEIGPYFILYKLITKW